MNRHKFFKEYKDNCQKITANETCHENLANMFEIILRKRTTLERPKLFNVLDENISSLIFEPLDYQFPIENRKETCLRAIYTYLSRNEIIHALNIFLYLIHNYNANSSWIWRTGFHILSRIGDQSSMDEFFYVMLNNEIWDPSNMFYEYFLYLLTKKDYKRIQEMYNDDYTNFSRRKRVVREPEVDKINHLIKLTTAVASYCLWKAPGQSDDEKESNRVNAELHFRALYPAIEAGMIVDSPLLNYVDVLVYGSKYGEALKVLQLYYDTCKNNIHAVEYLLEFMIEHQQYLPEITQDKISELRSVFVLKSIRVSPEEENKFLLASFRAYVEELDENGRHEELVELLFDYLCDPRWLSVEWPWRYLVSAVEQVGVSSGVVQERWLYIGDLWANIVFSSHANSYIDKLATILQ